MSFAALYGLAIAFGALCGYVLAGPSSQWSVDYWRGQSEHWAWMSEVQRRRAECAEAELRILGNGTPYR